MDLYVVTQVTSMHVYKLNSIAGRSIKHYFLLDKGDFIVQFMDMTEEEMRQNMDDILCLIFWKFFFNP